MSIEFDVAQRFVMPLGKHKGKQLYEIAEDDEGLQYLDWLVGQDWLKTAQHMKLRNNLESYLKDPAIAHDVDAAIADRESIRGSHDNDEE